MTTATPSRATSPTTAPAGALRARVIHREPLSDEVCALTLQPLEGRFDGLQPGCHIDVHLGPDLVRQYSPIGWAADGSWLAVAVKLEQRGRGGSAAMHRLMTGDEVPVGPARNNFRLDPTRLPILLLAGGIGVTPLIPMARTLQEAGVPFELHHLVRSRAQAAFDPQLRTLGPGATYRLHCDDEHGPTDLTALLAGRPPQTQVYVCGPEPMLQAVERACRELATGTVHLERFGADRSITQDGDHCFEVVLRSTGEAHPVPPGTSILQVLRQAGHAIPWACSEGVCGTCITDVVEGDIEHRDGVLSEDEQAAGDCMCLCVSRARGSRLVLDL